MHQPDQSANHKSLVDALYGNASSVHLALLSLNVLVEQKMKSMFRMPNSLIAVLYAAITVTGCAVPQQSSQAPSAQNGITQEDHQAHHPQEAATRPSGAAEQGNVAGQSGMVAGTATQSETMGQGSSGQMGMMGQGGQMDMKSMCEMHERMKNAGTPAERSAMMNERMKNMSPEMKQRHMEMMQRQCK
jgi:hypothetical protein